METLGRQAGGKAGKHAGTQARRHAGKQASRHPGSHAATQPRRHAGRHTGRQARRQAGTHTGLLLKFLARPERHAENAVRDHVSCADNEIQCTCVHAVSSERQFWVESTRLIGPCIGPAIFASMDIARTTKPLSSTVQIRMGTSLFKTCFET